MSKLLKSLCVVAILGSRVLGQTDQPADDPQIVTRLWVDATGSHMVQAKLLDVVNGKVRLERFDNQQIVEMSLDQLSLDDKKYCIQIYDSIQARLAEIKKNNIDPLAVIANQSLVTLDVIDQASRDFCSALNAIEARNPTTLQRKNDFADASQQFLKSVSGRRLQAHFLVDDVEPTKFISRDRRKIALTLSAPDIQLNFTANAIEVWAETSTADQMQRGDVLQLQGRINEPSRKSFGVIEFQLDPINVPPLVLANYREDFKDSVFTVEGTIRVPFYIDIIRKLSPADAKAFLDAQGATQLPAIAPKAAVPKAAAPKMGI